MTATLPGPSEQLSKSQSVQASFWTESGSRQVSVASHHPHAASMHVEQELNVVQSTIVVPESSVVVFDWPDAIAKTMANNNVVYFHMSSY